MLSSACTLSIKVQGKLRASNLGNTVTPKISVGIGRCVIIRAQIQTTLLRNSWWEEVNTLSKPGIVPSIIELDQRRNLYFNLSYIHISSFWCMVSRMKENSRISCFILFIKFGYATKKPVCKVNLKKTVVRTLNGKKKQNFKLVCRFVLNIYVVDYLHKFRMS